MVKKKKKNFIKEYWWVFLIILISVGVLLSFGLKESMYGSFISGKGVTNEIRDVNWEGIPVKIQSAYFGTKTAEAYDFGAGTDEQYKISNGYSINDIFTLSSSTNTFSDRVDFISRNYINAEMTIPQGTLEGTCRISANLKPMGWGYGLCEIEGLHKTEQKFYSDSGVIVKEFKLTFDKPTTIKINIQSGFVTGGAGSSSSSITLDFEKPSEVPSDEVPSDEVPSDEVPSDEVPSDEEGKINLSMIFVILGAVAIILLISLIIWRAVRKK